MEGKLPSLYQLSKEMEEALSNVSIDEETGEITGLEEVEALSVPLREKCVNVARYVATNDNFISGLEKARDDIERRIKSRKRLSETLKSRVLTAMSQMDERKIEECDIVLLARRSESVEIFDPDAIDPKFVTTKTETSISKRDIKAALKAGEDVPGARIAESFSLQIK